MAYDEGLAERLRTLVEDERGITEKRMFGGLAFLRDGRMFAGIMKDDLMVRVGREQHQVALTQPHVRPFLFTGKPMIKGFVLLAPEGVDYDDDLSRWIRQALAFVATLPAKAATPAKKPKQPKPQPHAALRPKAKPKAPSRAKPKAPSKSKPKAPSKARPKRPGGAHLA